MEEYCAVLKRVSRDEKDYQSYLAEFTVENGTIINGPPDRKTTKSLLSIYPQNSKLRKLLYTGPETTTELWLQKGREVVPIRNNNNDLNSPPWMVEFVESSQKDKSLFDALNQVISPLLYLQHTYKTEYWFDFPNATRALEYALNLGSVNLIKNLIALWGNDYPTLLRRTSGIRLIINSKSSDFASLLVPLEFQQLIDQIRKRTIEKNINFLKLLCFLSDTKRIEKNYSNYTNANNLIQYAVEECELSVVECLLSISTSIPLFKIKKGIAVEPYLFLLKRYNFEVLPTLEFNIKNVKDYRFLFRHFDVPTLIADKLIKRLNKPFLLWFCSNPFNYPDLKTTKELKEIGKMYDSKSILPLLTEKNWWFLAERFELSSDVVVPILTNRGISINPKFVYIPAIRGENKYYYYCLCRNLSDDFSGICDAMVIDVVKYRLRKGIQLPDLNNISSDFKREIVCWSLHRKELDDFIFSLDLFVDAESFKILYQHCYYYRRDLLSKLKELRCYDKVAIDYTMRTTRNNKKFSWL